MVAPAADARPFRSRSRLVVSLGTGVVVSASACDARESARASDEQPAFGTIATEPSVTLGATTAPADQRFSRISGVYRLPDKNTVVADASQQLQWFDSAGHLVHTEGEGRGAHEYEALTWLRGYRGDSLITYEAATGQLRVLDADGHPARTFQLATDRLLGFALPDSPFPDGSLLVTAGPSHVQQLGDGWWAVLRLLAFTAEGDAANDFGAVLRHPCGRVVERCAAELEPYGGTWTAGPGGVYITRPDRTQIWMVTEDSVEIMNGPESWRRASEGGEPTYSRLLIDSEGYLWAQSGDHSRAAVFDQHGELKGVVEVPSDLEIHQVGLNYVVGVVETGAGAQRVQLHRLQRTRRSQSRKRVRASRLVHPHPAF